MASVATYTKSGAKATTAAKRDVCFLDVRALAVDWAATLADGSLSLTLNVNDVNVYDSNVELGFNSVSDSELVGVTRDFKSVCVASKAQTVGLFAQTRLEDHLLIH